MITALREKETGLIWRLETTEQFVNGGVALGKEYAMSDDFEIYEEDGKIVEDKVSPSEKYPKGDTNNIYADLAGKEIRHYAVSNNQPKIPITTGYMKPEDEMITIQVKVGSLIIPPETTPFVPRWIIDELGNAHTQGTEVLAEKPTTKPDDKEAKLDKLMASIKRYVSDKLFFPQIADISADKLRKAIKDLL